MSTRRDTVVQKKTWQSTFGFSQDGLCHHCGKPETVTHFLTECPNNATCSAVVAASKKLNLRPTIDIILSDSRLHNIIIPTLNRRI